MKLPYIRKAFFALILAFSLSADLSADTVSWPVSVAVPETGIDGALYGRPVSVAVPETGIDGALYGRPVSVAVPETGIDGALYSRPVSVAFPDEIRSGSYMGRPVAVKVEAANTIDPDIVGLWHMDGDWLDSSGNNHDGIPYHGPTFSGDSMRGSLAGQFDGVDDVATIYPFNNFPTSAITVEFWMKSSDSSKNGTSISYATPSNQNEFLIYNYNNFAIYRGDVHVGTEISGNDGAWHHIAVTWKGSDGEVKLYKDGELKFNDVLAPGTEISQRGSLVFGQEQDAIAGGFDVSQAFKGLLDEVVIYKRILTAEEILGHYNQTVLESTPPDPPVLSAYSPVTTKSTLALSGTKTADTSLWINSQKIADIDGLADWSTSLDLKYGTNTFSVLTKNEYYIESDPVMVSVVRDDVAPTVTETVPSEGSAATSVSFVKFRMNDEYSELDLDAVIAAASVTDLSGQAVDGEWLVPAPDSMMFIPAAPFSDSTYTATIHPTDALGNSSEASLTFSVDNTPPTSPVITTDISLTSNTTLTFEGTRSVDSAQVLVSSAGATIGNVTYPTVTTWRVTVSGLIEGENVVSAYSKDPAGNSSEAVSKTFVVDTTPPAAPVVDEVPSITTASSLALSGTKEAASYMYVKSVKTADGYTSGTWSKTVSISEGMNNISLYAKDEAGNQSQVVTVQVTRDTTAPVISTSTPALNAFTNSADSIEINLNDTYSTVDLQASLTGALVKDSGGTAIDGTWSISGDKLIFNPSAALADNGYSVTINTADSLGNTGTASFSFNLDATNPVAQSLSMSPASPHRAEYVSFTVTFSENMNKGVKPTLVFTKGFLSGDYEVTNGSWLDSKKWRGNRTLTSDMGDGTYTVTVDDAKDKAGNVIDSKDLGTFILDTTPPDAPTISDVTTPTRSSMQTISGEKEVGSSIIIDGSQRVAHNPDTTWSYNYPLKEGVNNVNVRSRDEVSNDSATATVSITLDTTPPLFTIDVYSGRSATETQTISGKKEPGCVVTLNGETIFDESDYSNAWSYTINLVEGLANHLAFTATDALGNKASKAIDIVYDLSAPSPLAEGVLAADGSGRGDTLKLSWAAYSEPTDLAYYRIYKSTEPFTNISGMSAVATSNRGETNYTFTGLTEGTSYYFAVVPVDGSGNFRTDVNDASGVPVDRLAPEDVIVKAVTAGYDGADGNWINVEWNASADSWGDLSGYTVYFDDGTGYDGGTKLAKSTLSFTKSGLVDATAYKFKITTEDDLGNVSGGTVTTGVTRLDNPEGLGATPKNGQVILNWSAVGSSYLNNYIIYRLASSTQQNDITGMAAVGAVGGTTFTDTAVTNGTTYQYAVTAVNKYGAEKTAVQSITIKPREDDVPPVVESINISEGQVITAPITVTATGVDSESPVEKMEIYIDGVLVETDTGTNLSYAWNSVNVDDGNHTIKVVVYDKFNNAGELNRNVVVSLAPPSKPTITGHAVVTEEPEYKVNVSCNASADTTVTLYLNGVVIAAKERVSGLTFGDIVIEEGDNIFTAKATHRGGESAYSNAYTVTVDRGAPSPPTGLTAMALAGGSIQFSWQKGDGEVPAGYNFYMNGSEFLSVTDAGVEKTNTTLVKYSMMEYLPDDDSTRYYSVTALDSSGNESGISSVIFIASDRSAPSLTSVGFKYTDNSGSVVDPAIIAGSGSVDVSIIVSEPLSEVPFFSLEPQEGSPVIVSLSKITPSSPAEEGQGVEEAYEGIFAVDYFSPQGTTTYKFSGKDIIGNRGNRSGAGITLDVKGPLASVVEPLTILQITGEPVAVNVSFNEPPFSTPRMMINDSGGVTADITGLVDSGDGINWTGSVDISAMGDGVATFVLVKAEDSFGNIGTKVSAGEKILLYTDSVPAPPVPEGLASKPEKGGKVKLAWKSVWYSHAEANYKLYRRGVDESEATSVYYGDSLSYTDLPPSDDRYYYYVASVGLLDSESEGSLEVEVISDRTAPQPPTALTLNLDGSGVNAAWEGVLLAGDASVEVPSSYKLYRSNGEITSISGLDAVASSKVTTAVDTSATSAKRFYVVTALDALGNESSPSDTVEITFPVAPVKNLLLEIVDGSKPQITWESPESGIVGYHIYRNGTKLTSTPTLTASYTDGLYSGDSVTYGVSALNNLGNESPVREVTIPGLSIGVAEGTTLRRGMLESIPVVLTNNTPSPLAGEGGGEGESITVSNIEMKVGSGAVSTLSSKTTIEAGTSTTVDKVAATTLSAGRSVAIITSAVIYPSAGVTVRLTNTSRVDVTASGTAMEIYNEPFVKGAQSGVRIKVNNLGSAQMSFITSQNNGPTNQVKVFLKDQDGNVLASGRLDQRTGSQVVTSGSYATARIEPGSSFLTDLITFNVPVSAPSGVVIEAVIAGTYYHYNWADQVSAPGLSQSIAATISDVDYQANASIEQDIYRQGEVILITGQAISGATGEAVPNVPVRLGISVKGFDRYVDVTTDEIGSYSYTFQPGSGEAGSYSIWALHPLVTARSVQDSFDIIGFYMKPGSANISLPRNKSYDLSVRLQNPGEMELTGLSIEKSVTEGINFEVINNGDTTLTANEVQYLKLRFSGDNDSPESGSAAMTLTTDQGLTKHFSASITLTEAHPIISTSPSYIDTGMVRGTRKIENFTLRNRGLDILKNARIEGPSLSWISLTVANEIGDVAINGSKEIGFQLSPDETVGQGVYNDRVVIYSDNHIPYTYNIQVSVTSDAVGSVHFDVINEFYEDVSDAYITVQHQTMYELIYNLRTASDGTISLYDIPEGKYRFNISKSGHASDSGTFEIQPGMTSTVPVYLSVNLIDIEWSVTETTIVDKYEVTVSQTFVTNVPVPVMVIEPPMVNVPELQPGEVFNGEFKVTNYGLISAKYEGITYPTSYLDYDIEIMNVFPESFDAMQSVIVPYRIVRRQTTAGLAGENIYAYNADSIYDEVAGYGGSIGNTTAKVKTSYMKCDVELTYKTTPFSMYFSGNSSGGSGFGDGYDGGQVNDGGSKDVNKDESDQDDGGAEGSDDDGPLNPTENLSCDEGGSGSSGSDSTGSAGTSPISGTDNYDGFYPPGVAADNDGDGDVDADDEKLLIEVPAIYYVGSYNGAVDIYMMTEDGKQKTKVIDLTPDRVYVYGMDVSPDGNKIAISASDDNKAENATILVYDFIQKKTIKTFTGKYPSWSRDNIHLVYAKRVVYQDKDGNSVLGSHIYSRNSTGDNETQLTNTNTYSGWNDYPAWSPVLDEIAFTTRVEDFAEDKLADAGCKNKHALYLMDINGASKGQLSCSGGLNKDDIFPNWSPDGKELAFVRASSSITKVYKLNKTTKTVTGPTYQGGYNEIAPQWSPDGDRIINDVYSTLGDGSGDIWLFDKDGGSYSSGQNLTADVTTPAGVPTWGKGYQSLNIVLLDKNGVETTANKIGKDPNFVSWETLELGYKMTPELEPEDYVWSIVSGTSGFTVNYQDRLGTPNPKFAANPIEVTGYGSMVIKPRILAGSAKFTNISSSKKSKPNMFDLIFKVKNKSGTFGEVKRFRIKQDDRNALREEYKAGGLNDMTKLPKYSDFGVPLDENIRLTSPYVRSDVPRASKIHTLRDNVLANKYYIWSSYRNPYLNLSASNTKLNSRHVWSGALDVYDHNIQSGTEELKEVWKDAISENKAGVFGLVLVESDRERVANAVTDYIERQILTDDSKLVSLDLENAGTDDAPYVIVWQSGKTGDEWKNNWKVIKFNFTWLSKEGELNEYSNFSYALNETVWNFIARNLHLADTNGQEGF